MINTSIECSRTEYTNFNPNFKDYSINVLAVHVENCTEKPEVETART